ncbi:MAG: MATE family efflux transporter, partial [Sphingomonadales bacterium]|nr:MATE family efflux transporter [Sphingomonadales bacterium]
AFFLAGPWIIDLMTTAPHVREEARAYLPWIAAAPLIGIASWMLDGIFIGATLTREMRNAMLLSVAVYTGALALLIPALGNHGLWAGLMVLNATRGITMARLYPRAELKARGAN